MLEEAKQSIEGKSAVLINAAEWTVYTHMKIHQALDSSICTPPSIFYKGEEVQRGFPGHLLPTEGDVYQYIRGVGDMIEDAKTREDLRKRLIHWLTASLACAKPSSLYSIPTLYNVSEGPLFVLENLKDEGMYRRSVSWNMFSSERSIVFAATIASWGELSPDPVVDIYWVPLEGDGEDLLEEMRLSSQNQLLLEDDLENSLIETHQFDWDVYTLISCIFSAESTGQNYTSEDVEDILHSHLDLKGEGFPMIRAILHRNAPLIDLWKGGGKNARVEFTLIPPLEYYGLFMG